MAFPPYTVNQNSLKLTAILLKFALHCVVIQSLALNVASMVTANTLYLLPSLGTFNKLQLAESLTHIHLQ